MPENIDIFIGYASEDRARVAPLAQALEAKGWSVWWDLKITPGKTWDQVLEEALDAARCIGNHLDTSPRAG